jgi:hypothetical protein
VQPDRCFRLPTRSIFSIYPLSTNSKLRSGLIGQSQKMTVAAIAMAEKIAVGHRSQRVATWRQSFKRPNIPLHRLARVSGDLLPKAGSAFLVASRRSPPD